jgi:predicted Zn finger-like uncharacterized protein
MSDGMHTTCPSCHAVFRVTPEQLDARGGKVRCGKCAFVFNAFDTLVTPIETVSLIAPPPPGSESQDAAPQGVESHALEAEDLEAQGVEAQGVEAKGVEASEEHITLLPAPPTVGEPVAASFPIPSDDQIDLEADEINRRIAETMQLERAREAKREEEEPSPAPAPTSAKPKLEITPDLQEKLQNLQEELSSDEQRARWRRAGWFLGVLILGLVLAGQGAYFKRDRLAAQYPQLKPALQMLCDVLQCDIALLKDVELIKLESSDLQTDPDQANTVTLSASLRNLAPYVLAYPNLELTLTDANNQPVARRHFAPKEYLPKDAKVDKGIPSNGEVAIKLPLQLVGLNAVGYKLFVYYP